MGSLALLGRAFLDLLAPVDCAGCGVAGVQVCGDCRALLGAAARQVAPQPRPRGFPTTWAGPAYDGEIRALLLAWKEEGRAPVRDALVPLLGRVVVAATAGSNRAVTLVPVPARPDSQRLRGGDPLLDLTRAVARRVRRDGREVTVLRALRITRPVCDQAGLTAVERAENLRDAFAVQPWATRVLSDGVVVVVDDIVTTGATLVESARALQSVGVQPVAACVAATVRRCIPVDPSRQED
jgi:predicted amidophosphoribosyltransferase